MKNAPLLALLLVASSWTPACKNASNIYSPQELLDALDKAGGWAPLAIPDSKYRPGSIIKIDEDGTVRWIDHLDTCGYPAEVLAPEPGDIPKVTFTKSYDVGASALLNVKGIEAGPEFNKVSKTQLSIQEHSADALRLIGLQVWMEDPDNVSSVSSACMDELLKPNRFLVTEAFRVSKGTYTLFDQSGAAIKLKAPELGSLVQLQPDVKYEVTAEGSLVIEQPVYFAVRQAVRVGSGWEILGSDDEQETADARIRAAFLKASQP